MADAWANFVLGAVVGIALGAGIAWKFIHEICDHFVKEAGDRAERERARAETYKRIAEDLKAQIDFPNWING